jgi:hypothetical protein
MNGNKVEQSSPFSDQTILLIAPLALDQNHLHHHFQFCDYLGFPVEIVMLHLAHILQIHSVGRDLP